MIVRQDNLRRPAPERAFEQRPVVDPERAVRSAGHELVAEEGAGAVEISDEQRFPLERAQSFGEPVDKPAIERLQDVSRAYQPIQAGSRPNRRSRRWWNSVPSKSTTWTIKVGPLFMVK